MYKQAFAEPPVPNYTSDEALNKRIKNVLAGNVPNTDVVDATRRHVTGLPLGKLLKDSNLTGAELAKLTPMGYGAENLTFGQNMRALGHQVKQTFSGGVKGTASNVYDALKRGATESGGGFRAGVGTKMRYIPMGAKLTGMTGALPELRGALKKEDPTGQGRSQTERVGRAVGSVAGGLLGNLPSSVTNRLGVAGGFVGGMGATILGSSLGKGIFGGAGKLIDKGVSKLRGVEAGDVTNQNIKTTPRNPGSTAV